MWKWDAVACEITGQNTGKTVAIILGGAAGVAFLVICLLFARGLVKKHDGMCSNWINGHDKVNEQVIHFSVPHLICRLLTLEEEEEEEGGLWGG